jgi:hypothetical protein
MLGRSQRLLQVSSKGKKPPEAAQKQGSASNSRLWQTLLNFNFVPVVIRSGQGFGRL